MKSVIYKGQKYVLASSKEENVKGQEEWLKELVTTRKVLEKMNKATKHPYLKGILAKPIDELNESIKRAEFHLDIYKNQ